MSSLKIRNRLPFLIVILASTGCTYVKSLFPDKERDYQFRTEIPEMIVPDDLKPGSAVNKFPVLKQAAPIQETAPALPREEKQVVQPAASSPIPKQAETKSGPESHPDVQVGVTNSDVSSLMIDQPAKQAWRLVARALGRERIEISERNLDKTYFAVKYDPDAVKPEDNTIWDEITFVFGEDPSHELPYRISVMELGEQTSEVTVQNPAGQTLSDRPATRLLKVIADDIKQDSAAEGEDKAAPSP